MMFALLWSNVNLFKLHVGKLAGRLNNLVLRFWYVAFCLSNIKNADNAVPMMCMRISGC